MLSNIYIVLVKPIFDGNLGSTARAMKNMGLSNLILINPKADYQSKEAKKLAVSAFDILKKAKIFKNLENALKDINYILGTTTRKRKEFHRIFTPKGGSNKIMNIAKNNKIAILFGKEDDGLSNEALSYANDIIRIQASSNLTSLNLSQAVMVIAYELFQTKMEKSIPHKPEYKLASLEERKYLFNNINNVMNNLFFKDEQRKEILFDSLKNFINRAEPREEDLNNFHGFCKKIMEKIEER